jgi:hypothetical protein
MLIEVEHRDVPKGLYSIIVIDPAGDDTYKGDSWCISELGFKPSDDDINDEDIYIKQMVLMSMSNTQAMDEIVRVYKNSGVVQAVCVEVMAQAGFMLKDIKERIYSECKVKLIDDYTLIKLHPQGRGNKKTHISRTLGPRLNRGRIFISSAVHHNFKRKFKDELDNHPVGHDDGMDVVAYGPVALDKLNFKYVKTSFFRRKVISINDRHQKYNNHPQSWMQM